MFASMLWLVVTNLVPTSLRILDLVERRIRFLRIPAASIATLMLVAALIRPSTATAVTPPPAMRVVAVIETVPSTPVHQSVVGHRFDIARGATIYTVIKGDSLWKIARVELERADRSPTGEQITRLWNEIYQANRDVIGLDPGLILPGQVLTIPGGIRG